MEKIHLLTIIQTDQYLTAQVLTNPSPKIFFSCITRSRIVD